MKFVNAEYRYRNPNKLNIGGLTKSVCSIVIDKGSGYAVLIGDDSMYGTTARSSKRPNDHVCPTGHKATALACARRKKHRSTRYGFLAQWQRAQRQSTSSRGKPGFANMQRRLREYLHEFRIRNRNSQNISLRLPSIPLPRVDKGIFFLRASGHWWQPL